MKLNEKSRIGYFCSFRSIGTRGIYTMFIKDKLAQKKREII